MKQRRPNSLRMDQRNLEILFRALSGEKMVAIARDYGINSRRVGQIVQREKRYALDAPPG